MDGLLDHYNYADTARILNDRGFKTGDGLPLTPIAVGLCSKGSWTEEPMQCAVLRPGTPGKRRLASPLEDDDAE
jgi:hypothetical protein